jgi:hypothetical protein
MLLGKLQLYETFSSSILPEPYPRQDRTTRVAAPVPRVLSVLERWRDRYLQGGLPVCQNGNPIRSNFQETITDCHFTVSFRYGRSVSPRFQNETSSV